MGFNIYVLLCAMWFGYAREFNPKILPGFLTKWFATHIIEVLEICGRLYAIHAPAKLIYLFILNGYKYVGQSINIPYILILGQLGWDHHGYYGTLLWTDYVASHSMFKIMAKNASCATEATGPRIETMVLAFAISQFSTM